MPYFLVGFDDIFLENFVIRFAFEHAPPPVVVFVFGNSSHEFLSYSVYLCTFWTFNQNEVDEVTKALPLPFFLFLRFALLTVLTVAAWPTWFLDTVHSFLEIIVLALFPSSVSLYYYVGKKFRKKNPYNTLNFVWKFCPTPRIINETKLWSLNFAIQIK